MTNSVSIETFEPYFVEPRLNADGMQPWVCMDDRPPADQDTVIGDNTYFAIPGGVYGVAIDFAVAIEHKRRGRFTNNNTAVHFLAKTIHNRLKVDGVLAVLHEICAAEEGAPDIAANTSIRDQDIFESSKLINPAVTESKYERTVSITDRLISGLYIAQPKIARPYLRTNSEDGKESAIPSAHLKDMKHDSLGYLALWDKSKTFNTRKADADNKRAYVISMGALSNIHEILDFYYPIELEDLQVATAVRTATIRARHLLGPDDRPLPVVNDL